MNEDDKKTVEVHLTMKEASILYSMVSYNTRAYTREEWPLEHERSCAKKLIKAMASLIE